MHATKHGPPPLLVCTPELRRSEKGGWGAWTFERLIQISDVVVLCCRKIAHQKRPTNTRGELRCAARHRRVTDGGQVVAGVAWRGGRRRKTKNWGLGM